jgi:hypothetical protein
MNCYWNGKTIVVEYLKMLQLLEIVYWNCCCWKTFIGTYVARMENLMFVGKWKLLLQLLLKLLLKL